MKGGDSWGEIEETKTKPAPKKQDDGWGDEPDLKATSVQKQPSEDIDLSYLKNIKRQHTIRDE